MPKLNNFMIRINFDLHLESSEWMTQYMNWFKPLLDKAIIFGLQLTIVFRQELWKIQYNVEINTLEIQKLRQLPNVFKPVVGPYETNAPNSEGAGEDYSSKVWDLCTKSYAAIT